MKLEATHGLSLLLPGVAGLGLWGILSAQWSDLTRARRKIARKKSGG
jgi:hypothetical protein